MIASPKSVVITGSTRGLGFGLADAFLALGCHVTISGRTQQAADDAAAKLGARHPHDRIHPLACEVGEYTELAALWRFARDRTRSVDLWINNAGAGCTQVPLLQQKPTELATIIKTNLLGAVYGTRVALEGMMAQGHGQIFNLEGFGSDGKMTRVGMSVYGSTKTATSYFTRSVAKELAGGPVKIGTLFPGIVITDMLIGQFDGAPKAAWDQARRLYNLLGDTTETVSPWLARAALSNAKNGAVIRWLTIAKGLGRFLNPSYHRRDLFSGQRIPAFTP